MTEQMRRSQSGDGYSTQGLDEMLLRMASVHESCVC